MISLLKYKSFFQGVCDVIGCYGYDVNSAAAAAQGVKDKDGSVGASIYKAQSLLSDATLSITLATCSSISAYRAKQLLLLPHRLMVSFPGQPG